MALSFDEWKQTYINVQVSSDVESAMREMHGVDVRAEIDRALQQEYQQYINSTKEQQ